MANPHPLMAALAAFLVALAPPAASAPRAAQCSDSQDNDGDGLIDGADTGCTGTHDNDESPIAPMRWYLAGHTGCPVRTQLTCSAMNQPVAANSPTGSVPSMEVVAGPFMASWVTPSARLHDFDGESVELRVWGDAARSTSGSLDALRVVLFQRPFGMAPGQFVASAPMQHVTGTGIETPLGVTRGEFVATFPSVSTPSYTALVAQVYATGSIGQANVWFDSSLAPSCLAISTTGC